VGPLLIGVLLNGLVIMNVNPYYQQIIIGLIMFWPSDLTLSRNRGEEAADSWGYPQERFSLLS
jgi:predicted ABC-type sugar transport system permease subunit